VLAPVLRLSPFSLGANNFSEDSMPNAVQLIKQDHKKVEGLFQKFTKTKGEDAKRRIAEQAMDQLEVHAKIEEEIFYPAAKSELEDGETIEEALREHGMVKDLIEELRGMEFGDNSFEEKWFELVENVQHHVQEEENELLPQVQDSALDLAQCGEEMQERKDELMEEIEGSSATRSGAARSARSSRSGRSSGRSARH
jgi:hemerythrin superfamily protein